MPLKHPKVADAGAGRQRIFKRSFQLPIVRIAKNMIDQCAGARPFDQHGDMDANQLQRIALAEIHAGEGGLG